jgi:ferritin
MSKELKVIRTKLKDYLKMIYQLAQKCTTIINNLKASNPAWDDQKDLRLLFFIFMREGIQSYMLAESLSKKLVNPKWYKNNGMGGSLTGDTANDEKFMKDRMFHHGVWTKASFYMGAFSEVETSLRQIAKKYDNGSCDNQNITTLVNNIIDSLGLSADYKELWKVFAYTRNTTHSGGFHTHKSGNQSITYKGKQFDFIKDSPIDFLTPENLMFLLSEVIELMKDINSHPDIVGIAELNHSYSEVKFI